MTSHASNGVLLRLKRSWAGFANWSGRHKRPLFVVGIVCLSTVFGTTYVLAQLPLPPEYVPAQTTILYDANGKRLAELDDGENRVNVKLTDIPQVTRDAVIAAEDRKFYSHHGVDPQGIMRAAVNNLMSKDSLQGASTITQQYVKNVYVGSERTIWRKLREASIAVKLENRLTKDEILERYLNTVYFGRGASGIGSAAKAYFNKDVGQLDVAESAYLAGLIRRPQVGSLSSDSDVAKKRRDEIVNAMEDAGFISEKQASEALSTKLGDYVVPRKSQEPTLVGESIGTRFFVEAVRKELINRYGEEVVLKGGLRVTTTIDLDLQASAYDAVYGFLQPGEPAGALVSVNKEGEVVAMVGGRDWHQSKVNYAVGADGGGSGRQAGSTFKAFLLAELIREGYSLDSKVSGPSSYVIPKGNGGRDYTVENFGHESSGTLNITDATVHSVNTAYAQLEEAIGPENLVRMAKDLGITAPLEPNYSLVLGAADVSVIDMAGAYSTFMDHGVHIQPHLIREVKTVDGRTLGGSNAKRTSPLSANEADTVTSVLRQGVQRGTGTRAQLPVPVAGKTGTANSFGDAWFCGYTSSLTTAVWMGFPEGNSHPMTHVRGIAVAGGTFPAMMWHRFMEKTLEKYPGGQFDAPTSENTRILKPRVDPATVSSTTTSIFDDTKTTKKPDSSSTTVGPTTTSVPVTTTSP